jgi:Polyketide cyclase / dehydrase and lipid transport
MGTIITILLVLAVIIAIILAIALVVKKDYKVERDVIINRNKTEVFNYIKSLKNQDNFSKWGSLDPAMKKEYRGMDGTVGFVSSWEGNKKVGKGEQEIVKIAEGERVDYRLHFIKPFEGLADAYMTTAANSDSQTKVTWAMSSSMKYPMNIMLLFMNMEKMIGDDFSTGLNNLKNILEKN